MSMTLTLLPMVIALGSTVSTASLAGACLIREKRIEPVPTAFQDRELLLKTLKQHGLTVTEEKQDHFIICTDNGEIHYRRQNESLPFEMEVSKIRDTEKLMAELKEFEEEYGRNVQAYTVNKIMASLKEHGLTKQEEEVLPDDSILLTLSIS